MTESMLIRPVEPDSWEVARLGAEAGKHAFRGTLAEIARRCLQQRVVLVVPGTAVTLHRVRVPARSQTEIRMAVPYALEEQLASKIEGLHFAVGAKQTDGTVPVAVMSHEYLRGLLESLTQAGIQPVSVIPEQLALPWRDGVQSVIIDGNLAVARTSATEGYAIECDMLPQIIHRAGDNNRAVQLWFDGTSEQAAAVVKAIAADNPDIEQRKFSGLPVALYAEALRAAPAAIEMLQGEHRPQQDAGLRPWRMAIALAAAALLLHVGWSLWDLMSLKREVAAMTARSEVLFKNTFPEIKRIVNADTAEPQAEQEMRKLSVASGASDFVNLYAHAGAVLKTAPQVAVEAFTFKNGALTLSLSAPDAEALKALVVPIASASGHEVTVQDAQPGASGVSGKLLIGASAK